jgi:pimeloyl-ACP methyl ester carboxylesterase
MKSVVFIHGMFMTPLCWDGWVRRFAARGWQTQAPPWPSHDQAPAEMRAKHPDPALGKLTLDEVLATYVRILEPLAEKPMLVGHSMGGLVVQLLLQKKLGAAGVAVDSAPPKGVLSLKWSFLKSNWPVLTGNADQPFLPSLEQFRYAFAHTLPLEEVKTVYEQFAVPESRRVGRAPTSKIAQIDFAAERPPLLMISGGDDHIIPASLNASNFKKYKNSKTELKEYPGRVHYTLGLAGWEEVCDYAIDWLEKI